MRSNKDVFYALCPISTMCVTMQINPRNATTVGLWVLADETKVISFLT